MSRRLLAPVAVLAVAAAWFGLLTYWVLDGSGLTRSDSRLLHDVITSRGGVLTALAKTFTDLGTGAPVYLVVVAAGLIHWKRAGDAALPVLCLVWLIAGQLLRTGINRAVGRPRPAAALHLVSAGGYAFPSGHTASATIGYGLAALLLAGVFRHARIVIVVVAVLLALGVGLSRVYLGVHWPTDVLGGWALGVSWLALGALLLTWHSWGRRRDA